MSNDMTTDGPLPTEDTAEARVQSTGTEQIVYTFSGANMAGQTLLVCGRCGSLIKEENTTTHTAWHQNGAA